MSTRLSRLANQRGFTLIELLAVIAIMGILLALIATNFTTSQMRGRDAKRRGDIKALQNAFEQYYAANGEYDSTCATMATSTYLPAGIGADPSTGDAYTGNAYCQSDGTDYCICATLEGVNGNANAGPTTTSCAYAQSGDRDWYCLSNLQ